MAVRDFKKTGRNPLAYVGVNAYSPPNIKSYDRAPTTDDYKGFFIGDMWIDDSTSPRNIYMLVSVAAGVGTWLQISSTVSYPVTVPEGGTGLTSLTDGAVLVGDGTNDVELVGPGTDGQLLIAATGLSPAWADLTSSGGTITITGGANTLNIESGGAVPIQFDADAGSAVPALGVLDVLGGTGISTAGAGSAVTINASGDVANSYVTDAGTAVPAASALTISGGSNITTSGAGDTVTVTLTNGLYIAGDNLNENPSQTVNLNETIRWPVTNAAGTSGLFYTNGSGGAGGNRFIHNYDAVSGGPRSVFVGETAGNLTSTGTADGNTGIGYGALDALTTGQSNTVVGDEGCDKVNTGSSNVGIGDDVLNNLRSGSYNIAIGGDYIPGIGSGVATFFGSSESSNIILNNGGSIGQNNRITFGRHGAGNRQQNKAFVAGVRGVTTGVADAIAVLIDSSHQLGTVSSTIRSKQNVSDMTTEWEDLLNLNPVTFEYKEHPGIKQYGLIAEEVKEVLPRIVVDDENGEPETVQYHVLPGLLIHAAQNADIRIKKLEERMLSN